MSPERGSDAPGVFRIRWLPGTDVLLGTCHCAAEHRCQDPVEMWDWLLRHPDHADQPDHAGHPGHPEHPEHPGHPGHPDQPDLPDLPEDTHR
jgi:hypothetical protein